MPTVKINRFDRGMVNDPRSPETGVCRYSGNFDTETDPYRLIPLPSSESGDSSADTNKIQNFCLGEKPATAGSYVIFGLGVQSGASDAKIFYKDISTGASNDLDDAVWVAATSGEQTSGNTKFDCFFYYQKAGYIIGTQSSRYLWSYDPVNTTFVNQEVDLTSFTNVGQGLVHSKDDIAYIPYDNKIAKNDNDTWTAAALTLPEHFRIRALSEFGNYLAIATEPISGATPGVGRSYVFLWDRDSSLATLSDSIYWGEERLLAIGEVNGFLVGMSLASGTTWFDRRIVFRYLAGTRAVKFAEFTSVGTNIVNSTLNTSQQQYNNRLYFNLVFTVNGTVRGGVWSIGGFPENWNIVNERSLNNDTAFVIGTDNLHGFYLLGDYVFQSYDNSGSTYYVPKTVDNSTFGATSVYETVINPSMPAQDRQRQKKLASASLHYEALPASSDVTLDYRVDGGAWVQIFNETTSGVLFTERSTPSADMDFKSGREYEFRISVTGARAVVTELRYQYEYEDSQVE